ncbi:efflux transporter outer membrane subunit [Paraburkholderia bengalensis]|uniref:Efflux transporter outer membrane subunit n=1 Tax=Paraburkholderia bengalensis TaxID=2747562 RepID=A0ABU8IRM5_9BURK
MKVSQRRRHALSLASLAVVLGAAGCSMAPPYERPSLPQIPSAFREASEKQIVFDGMRAKDGVAEETLEGQWWTVFDDVALNRIEQQAQEANQDLKAALAKVKQSRAMNEAARSSLFPTLDAGFGPTRQKLSAVSQFQPDGTNIPVQTLWRAQARVSYEADLFGQVASRIDAAKADAEQNDALYRAVRLALQADVAQNYFALRDLDAQASVLDRTVDLRKRALQLVQRRFDHGEISELDVSRAKTELANAHSDAMTVRRMRAATEHGLAVLMGQTPEAFSMPSHALEPVSVRIPAGLPSSLLQRRPDIAAAERMMAAANARIGAAKAAFFPMLELTGAGGFESATLADLFRWSSRVFLLGPLAGAALTVPIFDGGRRQGNLDRAYAVYEEDVARYRQQVLTAFREVEDSLSDLRILEDQLDTQSDALKASERAAQLSSKQYSEGAISYIDVIDTERTLLQARRALIQLQGRKANQTVELIRALGGGWDKAVLPPDTGVNVAQK